MRGTIWTVHCNWNIFSHFALGADRRWEIWRQRRHGRGRIRSREWQGRWWRHGWWRHNWRSKWRRNRRWKLENCEKTSPRFTKKTATFHMFWMLPPGYCDIFLQGSSFCVSVTRTHDLYNVTVEKQYNQCNRHCWRIGKCHGLLRIFHFKIYVNLHKFQSCFFFIGGHHKRQPIRIKFR